MSNIENETASSENSETELPNLDSRDRTEVDNINEAIADGTLTVAALQAVADGTIAIEQLNAIAAGEINQELAASILSKGRT